MEKTYTYDPTRIFDNGLNQLRFELGDTTIGEVPEQTCVLCDEEYTAVLKQAEKKQFSFIYTKILCLRAIVSKLSYEVDMKVHDLSMNLPERRKHFQEMLNQLEKSSQYPVFTTPIGKNNLDGGHYFYLGMQENPKAK